MRSVEILLPNHLGHGFDYAVPEEMDALIPGSYVSVPFGNRTLPGIVWRDFGKSKPLVKENADGKSFSLKPVAEHYAHLPPLTPVMQKFIDWVAWYTASPVGAVVKMVMPVADALKTPNNRERNTLSKEVNTPHLVPLTDDQEAAAKGITKKLKKEFSVTWLDGVTGSGKTEVYFDAIDHVVQQGGQVLVMLPEISLSVQWLERFRTRFGFMPHVWHSAVSPAQRKHSWRAIVNGEARVVVGARSALFLPYRDLRLMVMDEEHDNSYKQEDGVIYHARDMAVVRAHMEKLPLLLVSATPSLETYQNVRAGKYDRQSLPLRYGSAGLPSLEVVDMRTAPLERGTFISQPLREQLVASLSCGHQSLLFLNRRGYAPLVLCRTCGHRIQCPQCTAWLVLHRSTKGEKKASEEARASLKRTSSDLQQVNNGGHHKGNLRCHHCGYGMPEPEICPSCEAKDSMHPCGPGVERVAEEVAAFLPQARLGVLASDQTDNIKSLSELIAAMQDGAIDILIGTQMVAKGHHFEKLALVGVVDADLGLTGGDLRASERTWQLMHQLSGRAGRAEVPGRVMLQTFHPDHPVMHALVSGERERFLQEELREREQSNMPPFTKLAAIIIESPKEAQAASHAKQLAASAPRLAGLEVLGPAPAPLYMLRGRYRQRLLVRAARDIDLQACLGQWILPIRKSGALRVKIDIDPYSFL